MFIKISRWTGQCVRVLSLTVIKVVIKDKHMRTQ